MAGDFAIRLRLLASDEGVAGTLARASASIVGLRREMDALGGKSRASLVAMREGMDSISRQFARLQNAAIAVAGVMQGVGAIGGIARTAADFESLEAAMRTVFGSAQAASAEMSVALPRGRVD